MKYYPAEIANKTFDRKMMGFDADQVIHFLHMVANQMESLIQDRKNLQEELKNKELELIQFRERDALLKSAITQTTQVSDKMKSEAERECKLIIQDAQQKAEMITRDAKESLRKIYQEISDLKKSKMQFEANLKAMAKAHLELLEQADEFMPRMRMSHLDLE
ncbi:MAG: DivIVA domain-containing protein [Pseudobdellovibrio sp.]